MTSDTTDYIDGTITSQDEFDSALHEIILSAIENNVDPRGAWEIRNGAGAPDWEIMVTELAKEDMTD